MGGEPLEHRHAPLAFEGRPTLAQRLQQTRPRGIPEVEVGAHVRRHGQVRSAAQQAGDVGVDHALRCGVEDANGAQRPQQAG
jgi:hypothetical protein